MIHALKQTLHTHSQSTSSHLGEHAIALLDQSLKFLPTSEPLRKIFFNYPLPKQRSDFSEGIWVFQKTRNN